MIGKVLYYLEQASNGWYNGTEAICHAPAGEWIPESGVKREYGFGYGTGEHTRYENVL